jgi:hypothetical protein
MLFSLVNWFSRALRRDNAKLLRAPATMSLVEKGKAYKQIVSSDGGNTKTVRHKDRESCPAR